VLARKLLGTLPFLNPFLPRNIQNKLKMFRAAREHEWTVFRDDLLPARCKNAVSLWVLCSTLCAALPAANCVQHLQSLLLLQQIPFVRNTLLLITGEVADIKRHHECQGIDG
jgi:hypothetical protein